MPLTLYFSLTILLTQSKIYVFLIQLLELKITWAAAGPFVIEAEHVHVLLLYFLRSVIERVVVCDRVVTVIDMSGVSTCPFVRLVRLGVILKTLLIGFVVIDFAKI